MLLTETPVTKQCSVQRSVDSYVHTGDIVILRQFTDRYLYFELSGSRVVRARHAKSHNGQHMEQQ